LVRSAIAVAVFMIIGTAQSFASSGGLSPAGNKPATGSGAAAFPVKARVSWGDGLGAGRGHQGQDLMANCGRPVVAAKAGRVTTVDYQASGAGNYAVVRGTSS
jgi:murein DD-endopeptidase MepM/ murein hydrolase activator NlpD